MSGGQTGADRAALDVAIEFAFPQMEGTGRFYPPVRGNFSKNKKVPIGDETP